jgi:hypothetical protein
MNLRQSYHEKRDSSLLLCISTTACLVNQRGLSFFSSEKAGGECLEKTKTRKDNQISNVLRRDHTVRTYDGFRNVDSRKEEKTFFRNPNAAFEMTKTFPPMTLPHYSSLENSSEKNLELRNSFEPSEPT